MMTGTPGETSPSRGRLAGAAARIPRVARTITPRPAIPPANESSTLSTSVSWISRLRDAPRAERMARSRPRPAARARSTFATLMQVMSSTTPTPPSSISKAGRRAPTVCSCSGRTVTPQPALVSGNSIARLRCDGGEVISRAFNGRARPQASDHAEVMNRPIGLTGGVHDPRIALARDREPHVDGQPARKARTPQHRAVRERKVLRHHTHDRNGRWRSRDAQRATDHIGVAAQAPLPVPDG